MKRILLTLLGALAMLTTASAGNLPFAYSAKIPGVSGLIGACGGSDIATATLNGGTAAQVTTTYSYQLDGTGTQWILNANASAAPLQCYLDPITGVPVAFVPNRLMVPAGVNYSSTILNNPRWIWTHQCTISWIDFGTGSPVLKSETFSY